MKVRGVSRHLEWPLIPNCTTVGFVSRRGSLTVFTRQQTCTPVQHGRWVRHMARHRTATKMHEFSGIYLVSTISDVQMAK